MPAAHFSSRVAPRFDTKDPALASAQAVDASSPAKRPGAHSSQATSPEPEYAPGGHFSWADAPASATKNPASATAQLAAPLSAA